ncbi:CDP-glycerol glycerophosphotransferase [Kitasatospora sp. SolWspMP-SS2h]|uniref:CDP-glycerol glycerophosphotransferase family protein n=1 Tax=Kitasatospora sp. SolWspMP-SS2h TaxID=1305729 RepID=UPI000DBFD71B|nr:CDP-glycerol glycerophosphotransferase family protein [Kitasatospora sp. SolWspMP-SS2h]RAJ33510.1 CDP-glycerol glycerophosphotransferase [Kitasatospora sp. SolWspMP-SS2h]
MSRLSLFAGRQDRTRTASDVSARVGLRQAAWDGGVLSLLGDGRLAGHPGDRPGETSVELELVPPSGRRPLRLGTRPRYLPEATDDSAQEAHGLDWTGFTALIDPRSLRRGGQWQPGTWRVEALVASGRLRARTTLAAHWCGSAEYPPVHWADADVLVVPQFGAGTLQLTVLTGLAAVTGLESDGDGFLVSGRAPAGTAGGTLVLRHRETDTGVACATDWDGTAFTARVGAGQCALAGHWEPSLLGPDGRTTAVRADCPPVGRRQLPLPDRQALYAKQLSDLHLQFRVQDPEPLVDALTPVPEGYELAGELPHHADRPVELVLRHSGDGRERRRPVELTGDGRFRTVLALEPAASDGRPRPLAKGVWELSLRRTGAPGDDGLPLRLHPAALAALPLRGTRGPKTFLLERRWHDTLILDSTPVLTAAERNARRQLRLRTADYPAARRLPLRDAVLYDVFGGRSYSCNPRAVHEELVARGLPLEHLWVVEDGQEQPPAGTTALRMWSPEWYEALATSRYLVGNTHFPDFLERREGQVVAQLWHGTPLKRIARQVRTEWMAEDGYLDRLEREVRQWNLLLSPSPFAGPILADSFDYRGEPLEAGYPRNDRLVRADPVERAAVRARLGVPEGRTVVLYAPTWRDDQRDGDRYRLDLRLDVEAARAALGEDHLLLLRPHVHVGGRMPDDDFVRDVSDHPDVADLMLAADVLVTDYSSLMFDFAVTGRPMLFFTYDLEHYRNRLRGFTFDFQAHAPGPLLSTSAEVVAALRDFDPAPYAERYRAFRERFCPLDDGRAAARVVDRMLELARPLPAGSQ